MNPQTFIRLSIGSLELRVPGITLNGAKSGRSALSFPCVCEIRLRGFPMQTAIIPLVSSPETTPDANNIASSFYLQESDLKALLAPGCPEWGNGRPVILFNGWIHIGKNKWLNGIAGAELHLRVKLDPDPRYIFQFKDKTKLSPQIIQLQGTIKQPIFSCKFSQDRVSPRDPLSNFWSSSFDGSELDIGKRERKGWNVKIHDLSGSAVAAAFITTPFVPSTGCDWAARSNPGAWLIVRSNVCRPESWHPWGKLEAWRERGIRDSICCRFHLLTEGHELGDLLMSEILISAEKGGEFYIDTDKQVRAASTPMHSPRGSGDFAAVSLAAGGFVMSCRVQGEGKCSKPLVQLAMRHVTCVEDVGIFMALAAAVDLSIEACRPFRRRLRRSASHSW
ncbi:hypothetical protein KY290_035226 [Solanum tuberosum]|uniref:Stress-induced protein n=1 Tax=Solanum tuberosum TaxID=4113 RepID=A0ABQ7U615_SOLTU|nr:hypothetical protein KY289_033107 [Solanum tuberosum]KAH0647747.1 hypothetical protein KY285_032995 [Solanum tuberosum]KAH0742183.1 hypothetical protein KY290_035226 [Solanum tuberosum]